MRKFLQPMFWLHYWLEIPVCLMEKRSLEYQVSTSYFKISRFLEVFIAQVKWQIYI